MDRSASPKFLLYLEPDREQKEATPIDDQITLVMRIALNEAKTGTADFEDPDNPTSKPVFVEGDSWKTKHRTACGQLSENVDYLLRNGMITNSLAPYYLRWYRSSIPEEEMDKVMKVVDFYANNLGLADTGENNQVFTPDEATDVFAGEHTVGMRDPRAVPREDREPGPSQGPEFVPDRFQ